MTSRVPSACSLPATMAFGQVGDVPGRKARAFRAFSELFLQEE